MAGLLLAGTGALLAFLYWLKPPPKRLVVPSNILWNRLLREKKKQTLLDRLRWLISLLIALAVGLAMATAIGQPEIDGAGEPRDITVVIDNSATMATRTSDGYTRWQHAVAHARALLQRSSAGGSFVLVDTTGQAPPTEPGNRGAALDVLDRLEVSLGGVAQFPLLPVTEGELYFISDGVMVNDAPAEAQVVSVFEPADNVGITAFEIRSVPAAPLVYQAFLQISNASPVAKQVTVRLGGSGSGRLGETMVLQPGESQGRTIDLSGFDRGPVRVAVTSDADAFPADDYAYSFLPVRARTRVALVSPGSIYLENLLLLEERVELEFITPEQYGDGGQVVADVYIFDRFAPASPPPGPALLFLPPDVPWLSPSLQLIDSPAVAGWDGDHEVLEYVALADLRVDRAARITPLVDAEERVMADILVGDQQLPLLVAFENPEKTLRFAFALEDSNFALQPGFPIFLSNALSWMMDEHVAVPRAPGRVEVPLPAATVTDLEGNPVAAWALADRTVFTAATPGLYTAGRGSRRLRVAVNLADPRRSAVNATGFAADVAPPPAPQALAAAQPSAWGDELWVLLLSIAAVLVIGEWFSYHRRVTV
jgi:hypothetical protein